MMIWKHKLEIFAIPLILLVLSCNDQNRSATEQPSDSKITYLQSINEWQEIELSHTDDRNGEWGGNTFNIRIYKKPDLDSLFADYSELEGSMKPPPPPKNGSAIQPWYDYKRVIVEKNGINLSTAQQELIEKSIVELTVNKLANESNISHGGVINTVIYKDSSLVIVDYPSVEWTNFQKLKKSILEK